MDPIILAAYDPHAHDRAPVVQAAALATALGGSLVVASVYDSTPELDPDAGSIWQEERKVPVRQALATVGEELASTHPHLRVQLREFDAPGAAHGLRRAMDAIRPALTVLGSRADAAPGTARAGHAAHYLLRHSRRAVEVVPAAAQPGPMQTIGVAVTDSPESSLLLAAACDLAEAAGGSLHLLCPMPSTVASEHDPANR